MSDEHADGIEGIAREALAAFELPGARLSLVADGWNHTFRVETADGRAFAMRVYRPGRRSDDEILTEMTWLQALAAAGYRVPEPVRGADGTGFVRVGAGNDARRVGLFRWIPGHVLGDAVEPAHLEAFGETIARLHEHGRRFAAHRGLTTWDTPFSRGEHALLDPSNRDVIDEPVLSTFQDAAAAATEAIAGLRASGEAPRIVHGDLHQDNVLIDGGGLSVIDFDDCMLAWPVQDLGVTMWEMGEDEAAWPLRETLRAGYERAAHWPERRPSDVDVFAANRGLLKADDVVRERAERSDGDARASLRHHADAITWFLERAGG